MLMVIVQAPAVRVHRVPSRNQPLHHPLGALEMARGMCICLDVRR